VCKKDKTKNKKVCRTRKRREGVGSTGVTKGRKTFHYGYVVRGLKQRRREKKKVKKGRKTEKDETKGSKDIRSLFLCRHTGNLEVKVGGAKEAQ